MIRYSLPLVLFLISIASNADEIKAGKYKLETRMLLPHLEEMRRTITTEIVCLKTDEVKALFPILKQPGMTDCLFVREQSNKSAVAYSLQCPGNNAAKGTALLEINKHGISAELNAKMGGKNMTFSQFSNAKLLGQCAHD